MVRKGRRWVDVPIDNPLTEIMKRRAEDILRVFGYKPRDWQSHAIQATYDGHDLLVRAGTACGKSLVFQVMVLHHEGAIVLVIAPINGLMEEQVNIPGLNRS